MSATATPGASPSADQNLATLRRLHDLETGAEAELARLREDGARTLATLRAEAEESVRLARTEGDRTVAEAVEQARREAELDAGRLVREGEAARPATPDLGPRERRALRDRVLEILTEGVADEK